MFLKIPSNVSKKPEKMIEDPNMTSLYNKLKEVESRPNIVTLEVFREFEPLFQRDNTLSEESVKTLTKKYTSMIDFYKETQIIVSSTNPTILLTLPSIFTPVRSLTPNEKNASLVATNAAMSHNNVPKYSSDAFTNMFNAIRLEQKNNISTIEEYRQRYIKCVQDFFSTYSQNKNTSESSKTVIKQEDSFIPLNNGTVWED